MSEATRATNSSGKSGVSFGVAKTTLSPSPQEMFPKRRKPTHKPLRGSVYQLSQGIIIKDSHDPKTNNTDFLR